MEELRVSARATRTGSGVSRSSPPLFSERRSGVGSCRSDLGSRVIVAGEEFEHPLEQDDPLVRIAWPRVPTRLA
jgi:hypothetical protein